MIDIGKEGREGGREGGREVGLGAQRLGRARPYTGWVNSGDERPSSSSSSSRFGEYDQV
jgi:hypothetical protein